MDVTQLQDRMNVGSPAAPGNLIFLEGFLNTSSSELGFDDLETVASAEKWLRNVTLWEGTSALTSTQHQNIIQFRSDLRAWILDDKHFQPINRWIETVPFQAQITSTGNICFQSAGAPYETVFAMLIEAIFESQKNGTWIRFKCCELPTCGWAYYDSTRSRTKRWCSMKTCGSRHKAREYYKRKR